MAASTFARNAPRFVRQAFVRNMHTARQATARNTSRATASAAAVAVSGSAVVAWQLYQQDAKAEFSFLNPMTWFEGPNSVPSVFTEIKAEIAEILDEDPNAGPFFVRLAWHCAGSYDKNDNSGGSNGATMRFPPESEHGGNAGLGLARDMLEPIKAKHPEVSYADLYTYAGVAAIELMEGPAIKFQPGRVDFAEGEGVTPDGRLPDGDKGAEHLRAIFYRMGFDDREIVALSGAHALGFCHTDRSGFSGPWTDEPTRFTNKYFDYLLNKKWNLKQWDGPPQFEDAETQTLMMLSTDMALLTDLKFRPHVDRYAADENVFKAEFAAAFAKLLELGVPRN